MYFVQTRCQSEINQNLKISAHETPTLHYLLVIFSTEKYLITFFYDSSDHQNHDFRKNLFPDFVVISCPCTDPIFISYENI